MLGNLGHQSHQGGFINGTDFIIVAGFNGSTASATNKSYVFYTINNTWQEVDPIPISIGVTHMANIIVRNKFYGCGGYTGGIEGPFAAIPQCFVYTHGNAPGTQWSYLPNLPAKRAGGGLVYDKASNSLIFASGAEVKGEPDKTDTWVLALDNVVGGWQSRRPSPYGGNHLGSTTVSYGGVEYHYILGGKSFTIFFLIVSL